MNHGVDFDEAWISAAAVNSWNVYDSVKDIPNEICKLNCIYKAAWLLKAVSCIDLTTLAGDDTRSNVVRLCRKACSPIRLSILDNLGIQHELEEPFTTAAVCVYPGRVSNAVEALRNSKGENVIDIAAVATGFPSGQYGLYSRLLEIEYAVNSGATEIDVVIDRSLVLTGNWTALYTELIQMKSKCQLAKMKTILAVGELVTFENIYKASLVAMMAGSDFIKTSTGKEAVNATLEAGLVMMRAIRDYYDRYKIKVGFKAAGGIRTSDDALHWLILVKRELGNDWLNKHYFRIGASSLLDDITKYFQNLELCTTFSAAKLE